MSETDLDKQSQVLREALSLLLERCPFLPSVCYWAGTSAISIEELGHRQSFDIDLHTRKALLDVRPILARLRAAFGSDFELTQAPDEFGSGFRGILTLPGAMRVTIEVLSNYEDVGERDLVSSKTFPSLQRVSLERYLADKVQCIAERMEARDLVDVMAVLRRHPEMEASAKRVLKEQDSLLVTERLQAWSDEDIANDLRPYRDVEPRDAREARDELLGWLKDLAQGDGGR